MTMLVGATLKKAEIPYWEPKLNGNAIMRIFPNSDKIPAARDDTRYAYCKRVGAIPFISGKCDGDAAKLGSSADARTKRTFRNVIMDLIDDGFPMVYCTDHHEPEGDATSTYTAATFISNFNALLAVVNGLPAAYRAKVKCGPVMTKQWTENTTGRVYSTWDPGTGDFYGIDAYHNSWTGPGGDKPFTVYADPAAWLAKIKAYKKTSGDARPRIFPELGVINPGWDSDGAARAAWYKAVFAELASWTPAQTGWTFLGAIVWNAEGTGGAAIDTIGTRRWFQLDRKHNGKPYTYTDANGASVTDPQGNYDILPPVAKPVSAYNTIYATYTAATPPPAGSQTISVTGTLGTARVGAPTLYQPGTTPPPEPTPTPTPAPGGGAVATPVEAPPPALSTVGAFTVLVTDGNLVPVAPPLQWDSLDLTLNRNAVSSGVVTLRVPSPAAVAGINAENARLCVIQNPLPEAGLTAGRVLMSGPIEKPGSYKWSAEDDPAGTLKVSYADNMLYLAERLVYPDPAAAGNAQTVVAYVINGIVGETALRQLVNVNIGPGALAARRHPLITLGAVSGATPAGVAVTYSSRLEVLTDVLRAVALAGGDLTFRVRDTGTSLVFEVYPGRTRSGATFSRQRGNLRAIETDPEAPTATVALVGGSGDGAARTFLEYAPATAWRRMETFVNQSTSSAPAELTAAAANALAEKGYRAGLSATAYDPFGGGFGTLYNLGDFVPVEDSGGVVRVDRVTSVRVTASAGGPMVFAPTIGAGPSAEPADVQLQRELLRRVARTERR